jgi:WD40 repeat protein
MLLDVNVSTNLAVNDLDLTFIQRKFLSRSDRVKGVDFHPTEPWILTGLYNGTVNIYNHETGAVVKTFEVAEVPVRCVRFIPRKNWFVAGSDDFQLRVFNYNTHEKVSAFEAHPDYIRCLTVHPTASIVLTGSDDMTIKAWDWEKNWKCIQVRVHSSELYLRSFSCKGLRRTYALHHECLHKPKGHQHIRILMS